MNKLMEQIKGNSTIAETSLLNKSMIYDKKTVAPTNIPMLNVALSGNLDGGLQSGLIMLAGPSKHFKTAFALILASAYMRKNPDSILVFYDAEFGTPKNYFEAFGIDPARVLWTPVTNVEDLKKDIVKQLDGLSRGNKVCFVLDSIGNLASIKEVEDTLAGKTIADMTRAKSLKSLFRMIVPVLNLKDVPLIAINHTYKEIGMFPKDIVGGGTGAYYGANDIWILGRRQDQDSDKELIGYNFIINIEKSRTVKEKSKIAITVSFDGGVKKYSGLLDASLEGKFMGKPGKGKYQLSDPESGEMTGPVYKESELMDNSEVWDKILADTRFQEYISDKYVLGNMKVDNEDIK